MTTPHSANSGIKQKLLDVLQERKLNYDDVESKLNLVIYTDGGSREQGGIRSAGYGIHGYVYLDEPVKSNSKSPKGYPTKNGYQTKISGKDYKVDVLLYIDMFGWLGDNTNNYAELFAGINAMTMIHELQIPYIVYSDSKYYLENMQLHLQKWADNGFISNGKEIASRDAWEIILDLYKKVKPYGKYIWVKGHDKNIGNEYADLNATSGVFLGFNPDSDKIDHNLRILSPDTFWDRESALHELFTEKRLVINNVNNVSNQYYQISMGDYAPSDETERNEFLGKRIADTCLSVITLPEEDPVIARLAEYCRFGIKHWTVATVRLDLLTQGMLYDKLKESNCNILNFKDDSLVTPSGVNVCVKMKEARLTWRLIEEYNWIGSLLHMVKDYFEHDEKDIPFTILPINHLIYDVKEIKKEVNQLKLKNASDNHITHVPITLEDGGFTNLRLTMGVDCPSMTSLGRLGKCNAQIYLVYWFEDNPDIMQYATVVQSGGGYGLWMGAYSNNHFINRGISHVS